jgi:hypothetical protein
MNYNKFKLLILILNVIFIISCKNNKEVVKNSNQKIPAVIIDTSFSLDNKNMRMNILNMQLNKDILTLEINYSGGCKEHQFKLYTNGEVENSNLQLFLVDLQNEDFCKMLITDTLKFNLSNLKSVSKNKLNLSINRNQQILQYP